MGSAMVTGLEKNHSIWISEPMPESVKRLSDLFPTATVISDNLELIKNGKLDVLVLAVKPQILKAVLEPLASSLVEKNPLILSIVAGIQIKDIIKLASGGLDNKLAVVRVMPNTPALLNQGASGLYASPTVSDQQKNWAFEIMESISKKTYWLENEGLIGIFILYIKKFRCSNWNFRIRSCVFLFACTDFDQSWGGKRTAVSSCKRISFSDMFRSWEYVGR